jgi:hypothetical protein
VDDFEPIAILSNSIDRGNEAAFGYAKIPCSVILHRGGVSICDSCSVYTFPQRDDLRASLGLLHHIHGARSLFVCNLLELTLVEPAHSAVMELHLERANRLVVFDQAAFLAHVRAR